MQDEPPDKYKCIKVPLKQLMPLSADREIIFDTVKRTNKIIVKTYLLLRLWILDKYHSNQEIPKITKETIISCMQTLNSKSYSSTKKKDIYKEFRNLFDFEQEDGSHLTQILQGKATTILTMIENNVKANFFSYVKRYVNSYFYHEFKDEIEQKLIDKDDLKKELFKVTNDIINNSLTSDDKYHDWLDCNRYKIVPELEEESDVDEDVDVDEDEDDDDDEDKVVSTYYFDVKANPQKYLKHMIWMSLEIEKLDKKMFQFCPLQNNIIPKFVGIETASIIDLFISENTNYYQRHVLEESEAIWGCVFNLKKLNKLKMRNYSFDNAVSTDGYSVSVRFINNKYVPSKLKKIEKMQNGKIAVKGMSKKEKAAVKKKKEADDKKKQKEALKEKLKCDCGKIVAKGSMYQHTKSAFHKKYLKDNNITENKYIEFPYITEVPKSKLEGKHVFVDPGKRDLFSMLDDKGNRLTYSNRQRIKGIKRLEQQSKLQRYRDLNGISIIENNLSKYNSKTCDLKNYKLFITEKIKTNDLLYEKYEEKKFRKYKFYSFINTKRCEAKMLNLIENTYGEEIVDEKTGKMKKNGKNVKIIIGDWSIGKQMRNFISTPNVSLKRKLKERFQVFNIDEFRTSCLHYKTEESMNNLYVKDWYETKLQKRKPLKPMTKLELETKGKTEKIRKLHSVLTFKMENDRKGCINRDYNGCLNIRKIFNEYMLTGERPYNYLRTTKQNELTSRRIMSNSSQPVTTVGIINGSF